MPAKKRKPCYESAKLPFFDIVLLIRDVADGDSGYCFACYRNPVPVDPGVEAACRWNPLAVRAAAAGPFPAGPVQPAVQVGLHRNCH